MVSQQVLVVDDDVDVADLVSAKLAAAGISAGTAYSAKDALQQMEQKPYSIVVSDIHMPGMTGVELISALKQFNPLVQVIMRTADATMGRVIDCADRGASDFFSKDDDLSTVIESVRAAQGRVEHWVGLMDIRTKPEPAASGTA